MPSSGFRPRTYEWHGNEQVTYGKGMGKKQGPLYNDKGGASRFFKQIGGEENA